MLFALFLGAGNIIFPPHLGQMAGENFFTAMAGFLITGVGLPLIAVLAIAYSGGGLQTIASRVSPSFGIIFTIIIYMAIGPFFGIPRTATVSYEIGILPFLPEALVNAGLPLAIFTLLFFSVTVAWALNPAKLVDRIGKILTPILFLVIGALAVKSVLTPMGEIGLAQGDFIDHPFFRSFVEGYLTMDVIAALVFGTVIIQVLQGEGVTEKRAIMKAMIIAGSIAAIGLSLVYISLGFIGATSVSVIGLQVNGGVVLALTSTILYGTYGTLILALTIIFACLTTSIGLVSASGQFFTRIFPKISYKQFVFIFAGFSALVANVGLTKLISISVPVLMMVYPLAIVLIFLSLIDKLFARRSIVYILALIPTTFVSVFDGLLRAGIDITLVTTQLEKLPLFEQQIGWLVPALIGTVVGILIVQLTKKD